MGFAFVDRWMDRYESLLSPLPDREDHLLVDRWIDIPPPQKEHGQIG